ncbi:DUF3465 domain-containing protein [Acinetobacter pragensis]|uniref:DUF3465 domain-containing protein n=1 Tax=Acinetobacter pragensis TaxID=1806892 RepID=A0A151Y3P0_9GAMM|nr:DUF3465 domain-containing protein [Acinetobacter pragensis]KYQ72640.1 hypothetical protein AZH43_09115 [Acinetobacter pragensis]
MANKTNIGIGAVIALLAAAYFGIDLQHNKMEQSASPHVSEEQLPAEVKVQHDSAQIQQHQRQDDTAKIAQAFAQQQSNVQVQASGQVKAVLRDDTEGSKHQKFILKLSNGQTVLVAHNIDLSPRIQNLQKGDMVEFYGEYEYSGQGGVIHWTHLDPNKRHEDGWLKHDGKIYQ